MKAGVVAVATVPGTTLADAPTGTAFAPAVRDTTCCQADQPPLFGFVLKYELSPDTWYAVWVMTLPEAGVALPVVLVVLRVPVVEAAGVLVVAGLYWLQPKGAELAFVMSGMGAVVSPANGATENAAIQLAPSEVSETMAFAGTTNEEAAARPGPVMLPAEAVRV